MAQLLEGAQLDLSDALTGHTKPAPYLLKRPRISVVKPEPRSENLFLPARELVKDFLDLFPSNQVQRCFGGRNRGMRLNEIGELAVVLFSYRSLERERLKGDAHNLVDALYR